MERSMFKNIKIELEGPICSCEKQNLEWYFNSNPDNYADLNIWCKSCNTKLKIPHTMLLAYINLEKKYPKGILQKNDNIAEKDRKFLKDLGIVPDLKADA